MRETIKISGGCHCGALQYELLWPAKDSVTEIMARRCSCSFCTRFNGTWTSHPDASLIIKKNPNSPANSYRFGTGTADFLFCSRCGISPMVTCEISGKVFAVVNVNTFDQQHSDPYSLDISDSCFDGETTDSRLDRRQARWIGNVTRIDSTASP